MIETAFIWLVLVPTGLSIWLLVIAAVFAIFRELFK